MSGGPPRIVVLVSGSGSNLEAIIASTRAGEIAGRLVGVVSDRAGVYALERARQAGIPEFVEDYAACGSRPAFDAAIEARLGDLRPDIVVLAGFMRILAPSLVNQFRGRMLNIHPSLLPKYPGLHTYRRVLQAGDAWHGSTVHFVTPELDAGPAIIQYRIAVRPGDTETTLRERVLPGEHLIYPRAIGWLAGNRLELRGDSVWQDGQRLGQPLAVTAGE